MNLIFVLYTYDRIDDARINMEVIDTVWKASGLFSSIRVVHAYNGHEEWYPQLCYEDLLVRQKNSGHVLGAGFLISQGIKEAVSMGESDYIIILAADTWLLKPSYIYDIIQKMESSGRVLATAAWGLAEKSDLLKVGMSTDFFIVKSTWAQEATLDQLYKKSFWKIVKDFCRYSLWYKSPRIILEKVLLLQCLESMKKVYTRDCFINEKVYLLTDRHPVHSHKDTRGKWIRKAYWEKMGLLTHHDPEPKKEILISYGIKGKEYIPKLIDSKDRSYYNQGIRDHYQ